MASHHRHARRARRSWCAGLAAVAVVAALLASGTASAAAPRSADCPNPNAVPAEPLIPFNTIAYTDGSPPIPALRVGGHLYPSDNQPVQVYVLCRDSLQLLDSRGYQANGQAYSTLESYLKSLRDTDLVVVTHAGSQPPLPANDLDQLDQALQVIGGNLGAKWAFSAAQCWSGQTNGCSDAHWGAPVLNGGSFTVIGVPGLAAGQAWRETAAQNGTQDGRMTGDFTLGVTTTTGKASDFTVVPGPDPYVTVNTCTSNGCAVQAGDKTYPADPGVANGFHVVVLDRTTLAKITNVTVTSTAALDQAILGTSFTVPSVAHWLPPYGSVPPRNDQRLVILQSVGDGRLSVSSSTSLLADIDQLGGTPDYLMDAVLHGCRYALAGAATDLPWHGTAMESSTAMKPGYYSANAPDCSQAAGAPKGQIDGVLQRGRDGLYTPTAGDPAGSANQDLYGILFQAATDWPMADDPGLKYIASHIGLSGYPDVRSAYTNLNIDFGTKSGLLASLNCTAGPDVCGPDFDALKTELLQEFDWVQEVRAFGGNLRSPFEATSAPTNIGDITQDLVNGLHVPDDSTSMNWLNIFSTVMAIAAKVAGPAAPVFGVLSYAGTVATMFSQSPDGTATDAVKAKADELKSELALQQKAYIQWTYEMEGILVYDYGKLKAVGTSIDENKPGWNWDTKTTTPQAIDVLDATTRASAYAALLPLAWSGYDLKPGQNQDSSNDVTSLICDEPYNYPNHHYPFASALPQNQFHADTTLRSSGLDQEVWLFANTKTWTKGQSAWADLPSADATQTSKVYGDASTGAQGAYQYEASWWRTTYNPPGHVTCSKGTGSMPVDQVWSQNYPPPDIKPPLP